MTQNQMIAAGEELTTICSFPGWPIVIQLLQYEIDESSRKLLALRDGGDPIQVTTLHTRYRAQLDMLNSLQYSVQARIAAYDSTN
jgi:hypothetical protein